MHFDESELILLYYSNEAADIHILYIYNSHNAQGLHKVTNMIYDASDSFGTVTL